MFKNLKFDTLKICTCHFSFATFRLHLEQMMTVPGSSIELLHLGDTKFSEVFKLKIMNNDEIMKSRENEKFQILPEGPPRMKKRRRVLRTIFFCAAARRQPQKVRRRRQERARMLKNLKSDTLKKCTRQLSTATF